ncbi:hypothetical protein Ancab_014196 [Ancistrocladus abbreviatus]
MVIDGVIFLTTCQLLYLLVISWKIHIQTGWGEREGERERQMSSDSGEGKAVCVTGASGFIASWLVKLLLLRGYTVRASVRNINDPLKTGHLISLDGAKERLHLFEANLLEDGAFDSAIEGCEGVFHTASPVYFIAKDPQAEIVDPAVKGTLNVLRSCAKFPHVKRVVLTSSMAAVLCNDRCKTPETVVDESWFSDPEILKESKFWYELSKILAEQAGWKFVEEKGIDVVVMNPAVVIGPLLQPKLNESASSILDFVNGSKSYGNATFGWINVKDVANAHIKAFEITSASGRYCLAETVAHYSTIVEILHELYPNLQLPDNCADDKPFASTYQISKEKMKSLGIDYIPLKVSLKETVKSLKEKKFFNF